MATETQTAPPNPESKPAENPFAELDAAFEKGGFTSHLPEKKDENPPDKTGEQPPEKKPEEKKEEKLDTKAEVKPDTTVKLPDTSKQDELPKGIKQLREAYERQRVELTNATEKLAADTKKNEELQKQLADLQKQLEGKGGDTTALAEENTRLVAKVAELEGLIAGSDYTTTKEYESRFVKPFADAATRARTVVKTLSKSDGTPATEKDFDEVYNLDEASAWKRARQVFGEDAPLVMQHYNGLKSIDNQARQTVAEHRTNFKTRQTEAQAVAARDKEIVLKMVGEVIKDMEHKQPDLYKPVEGDAEGNDLLEKGFKVSDALFATLASDKSGATERAIAIANLRNRSAALSRTQLQLKKALAREAKLTEEKAALETQLKEIEEGGPTAGKREGGERKTGEKNWKDDLRETLA